MVFIGLVVFFNTFAATKICKTLWITWKFMHKMSYCIQVYSEEVCHWAARPKGPEWEPCGHSGACAHDCWVQSPIRGTRHIFCHVWHEMCVHWEIVVVCIRLCAKQIQKFQLIIAITEDFYKTFQFQIHAVLLKKKCVYRTLYILYNYIINSKNYYQIRILLWFLKDHVTLETGEWCWKFSFASLE